MVDDGTAGIPAPVLTAQAMIDAHGFDLEPASSVVVVFDEALMTGRRRRRGRHPFRQVTNVPGRWPNPVDQVLASGPGAAVAAVTVEFLAAFGVRRIVAVGTAGILDASTPRLLDRPLVVARAESDDGTSRHYHTTGDIAANEELTAALVDGLVGESVVAMTTDVPFRHTPARLAEHRRRADVVEMEAAALFAAARRLGVAAGAVVVASDRFIGDSWYAGPGEPAAPSLPDRMRSAVDGAIRVLGELP